MGRILQGALAGPPEVSVLELAEMPKRVVELEGRACAEPSVHAEVRRISTAKLNGLKN